MVNDYSKFLNAVSDRITTAEAKMRANAFALEAHYGNLSWKKIGNRFRISMGDIPLSACPFEVRVKESKSLDGLMDAADKRMEEFMRNLEK